MKNWHYFMIIMERNSIFAAMAVGEFLSKSLENIWLIFYLNNSRKAFKFFNYTVDKDFIELWEFRVTNSG